MEHRRTDRFSTHLQVRGRIPASPIAATILDVSTTGCRLEAASPLVKPGATILLDLPGGGAVAGQIVWRDDAECGVKFHEQISGRIIAQIISGEVAAAPLEDFARDRFGRRLPALRSRTKPNKE
jgi:hypothetical protein